MTDRDHAYFVQDGVGPGILLLHSLWGLTGSIKRLADDLADSGYTVLAPDVSFGLLPKTEEEGLANLADASPDRMARLVVSSAGLVAEKSSSGKIGIVGFGMGGSLGLWASVRLPEIVSAAVSFYGSQQIDFAGSRASYLIHLAESDDYISEDEAVFMEATMGLESLPVEVVRHQATRHGFADAESDTFSSEAFASAWEQTKVFLAEHLPP